MTLRIKKPLLLSSLLFLLTVTTAATFSHAHAADTRTDILQAADKKTSGLYVRQRFVEKMNKPFVPGDQRKKMLIMGDSHAQDFYNALSENNIDQRYQVSTRRIPAICGLYLARRISSR